VNPLPRIKSSIRSVKTDAERRASNFAIKSSVKTAVRKTAETAAAGKSDEATTLLAKAASTIDKAASKGVLHKNTAARKKSRLTKKVSAAAAK
jgi:small subunit ribosomal protein S20